MKPNQLTAWLEAQKPRAVSGWALRQQLGVRGVDESYAGVQEYETDRDPSELAQAILTDAQEDADDVSGGPCTYVIVALDANRRPAARKQFRVQGERMTDEVGPSEPPNAGGLVAQSQRHLEFVMRQFIAVQESGFRAVQTVVSSLERQLDRQNERIASMEGRELKVIETREKLLSEQHIRELDHKKLDSELAIREKALAHFQPLIPAVLGQALKLPLAGDSAPAVDALLTSLTEEQQDALFRVLKPEQLTLLDAIYKEARRRHPSGNGQANGQAKETQS